MSLTVAQQQAVRRMIQPTLETAAAASATAATAFSTATAASALATSAASSVPDHDHTAATGDGGTIPASSVTGIFPLKVGTDRDLESQSGSIGATTLVASAGVGLYRVNIHVLTVNAGTAPTNSIVVTLAWNDGAARSEQVALSNLVGLPYHDLTSAGAHSYATFILRSAAAQAISISTTESTPSTPTATYTLRTMVEQLR